MNASRWLLAAALSLSVSTAIRAEEAVEKDLTVHEWGVFRVHTDAEMANADLAHEWNELPEFVYGHIMGRNIPQHYGAIEIRRRPIVFFHAARSLEVQMKIDFPGGMPGVWWPGTISPAREGEQRVKQSSSLLWELGIKVPPRGRVPKTVSPPEVSKDHWIQKLRQVKCDEVFAKYSQHPLDMEREKFVYYDGIFPQGKWLKIEAAGGKVTVTSQVKHSVFDVTVIDHRDEKKIRLARIGELQPGAEFTPTDFESGSGEEFATQAAKKLTGQLVVAGLFEDEAQVLADLWKKELFETPGLHVCFRLPQEEYERRLPMTLSPRAGSLVRVGLVVQTHPDALAEQVAALVKDLDADDFATREAAQKKLKAMGRSIYGHLVRLQKTDLPAEVRIRMRNVLAEIDSSLAFPQQQEKP